MSEALKDDAIEADQLFAKELWLDNVQSRVAHVGEVPFLRFVVGRKAPAYFGALQKVQMGLPEGNVFKGRIELEIDSQGLAFPKSLEATVLEGIIGRSTRVVAENVSTSTKFGFVPFHNKEENKVIQPANHLILGRRGVGKSTLLAKAIEVLRKRKCICVVIDMQAFANRDDTRLSVDLVRYFLLELVKEAERLVGVDNKLVTQIRHLVKTASIDEAQLTLDVKSILKDITRHLDADLFLFLDDFHLLPVDVQPQCISALHAFLKGSRGWLKIAGLTTLVKFHDQGKKLGLQVPGDAQIISLDLTLTDPKAAEEHLRSILANYLNQVGVSNPSSVLGDAPFKRLVWANAGVVRDFLQMFSQSLASARKSNRSKIVLSDVNLSIGELGKQKQLDLEEDTRNHADSLKDFLVRLEEFCLNDKKVNAFLVKEEASDLRGSVKTLSDLRMVHLIHPSITPHKAGERFEAYMIDYSLFVGFRRKRNIKEIQPKQGLQFQVKELRSLPVFT